jgi:hypothetical protein
VGDIVEQGRRDKAAAASSMGEEEGGGKMDLELEEEKKALNNGKGEDDVGIGKKIRGNYNAG